MCACVYVHQHDWQQQLDTKTSWPGLGSKGYVSTMNQQGPHGPVAITSPASQRTYVHTLMNGSIFSNTSIIRKSRKFNQMCGQFLLLPFLHVRSYYALRYCLDLVFCLCFRESIAVHIVVVTLCSVWTQWLCLFVCGLIWNPKHLFTHTYMYCQDLNEEDPYIAYSV